MNNRRDVDQTAAVLLKVLFPLEIVLFLVFLVYPHMQSPSLSSKVQTGSPHFFREKKAWFSKLVDYSRDEDHVYPEFVGGA